MFGRRKSTWADQGMPPRLLFVAPALGHLAGGEIAGQIGGFSVDLSPIIRATNVLRGRNVRVSRTSLAQDDYYALDDAVLHFLLSFFVPSDLASGRVTAGSLRVTGVTGTDARKALLDVSHHVQSSQVESAGGGKLLLFISGRCSSTNGNNSVF